MNIPTLSQLYRGLHIAQQIAALQEEMAAIFKASPFISAIVVTPTVKATRRKKGSMSAAGRANIRAAQKARWTAFKKGKAPAAMRTQAPAKKKGGLTPAGRARLAAAMRKRWAAAKAGKGPAPTAGK